MIHTKKDIALTILKEVFDVVDDAKADLQEIYLLIDTISDTLRADYLNQGSNDVGQFIIEMPSKWFPDPITVIKEAYTNRYCADLAVKPLFVSSDKGIWSVSLSTDVNDQFVIRRFGSTAFSNGLKINDLEGKKSCQIAGDRIYVNEFVGIDAATLYVAIIPQSASIPEDVPYPVPETYIKDIIAFCKTQLQQLEKDLINDNQ